jgi:Tfp pilus assembly protein PilV
MTRLLAPPARRRSAADEGMSVVEVVIAMSILLFVMIALWSLMLASTTMGQDAKARALAVETANGYIEWVRSLPYKDIGFQDPSINEPSGTLYRERQTEQGGLVARVVPAVTWEATAGVKTFKILNIQVTVSTGTRQLAAYSTTTYIRDRRSGVTSNITEPSIRFSVPANQAIVFGSQDVMVTADSSGDSPEYGVPLASVTIKGDDTLLTDGNVFASWTMPTSTFLTTRSLSWNTILSPWSDGGVMLVASASNTVGMLGVDVRYVLVDNVAPNVPPSEVTTVPTTTDVAVPMQWTQSTDGRLEVPRYYLTIYRQGPSDTSDYFAAWPEPTTEAYETPPTHPGTTIPYTLAATAFSRYVVSVKGCGPRWNLTDMVTWTSSPAHSAFIISRPRLSSVTSADAGSHTLAVTPPTFYVIGLPQYTWYASTDSGVTWTAAATTTDATWTNSTVAPSTAYRYRVQADFTPASGTPASVGTQVMAQTSAEDYLFSAPADWTQ